MHGRTAVADVQRGCGSRGPRRGLTAMAQDAIAFMQQEPLEIFDESR